MKPSLPKQAKKPGKSDATRAKLLACAGALLVEGNGAFEISALAARTGVSAGLSYHHFESKTGLIAAVVEQFYDRYDAAAMDSNPLPGAAWPERERARVERVVDFHLSDPLAPVILSRLSREPQVAAVEARRVGRHVELGTANVRSAQRAGLIPRQLDANLLVAMMMGGLQRALGEALARNPRPHRDWLVEEIWGSIAALARLPDTPRQTTTKRRRER